MKAVPASEAPTTEGWAVELKWDGMRIEAWVDGDRHRLWSSNGRDVTTSYPELAALGPAVGIQAVFDGEVVVFDQDRPSFSRLQQRIHIDRPDETLLAGHPIMYLVFDLLMVDGTPMLDLDYRTRRRILDELLPPGPNWTCPPYMVDDAPRLIELARSRQLEGVVMKRLDSVYQPGIRSSSWIKLKIRRRQEFVVGGWLEGRRSLEGRIGSLLVGYWDGGELVVAGRVGSGLSDLERQRLSTMLTEQSEPPFARLPPLDRPVHWVKADTVVEVEFAEWTVDGTLRHPTYHGVRTDRHPGDVTREPLI
jgi:bifunctional non-homologous end joining protein LigD